MQNAKITGVYFMPKEFSEHIFGEKEIVPTSILKLELYGPHGYYYSGKYNINPDQWQRISKILFEEYQEKMDKIIPC